MTVDGSRARIGQKVDGEHARIAVDGVPLPTRPGVVYYLAYKPQGVISTAVDPQNRPTVTGMVPSEPRVFPVGRLDADSEGLILLTNDGDLANYLTHPRYGVPKMYVARVKGRPTKPDLRRLTDGIGLDDGTAKAVRAVELSHHGSETLVEIVMTEGRKREVRRMLAAIGYPVTRLVRTSIGPLTDHKLRAGHWRRLTLDEVRGLYSAGTQAWEDAIAPNDEAG